MQKLQRNKQTKCTCGKGGGAKGGGANGGGGNSEGGNGGGARGTGKRLGRFVEHNTKKNARFL